MGVSAYPTLKDQRERLARLGFDKIEVIDMLEVYQKHTDQVERKRIEKLEMMDEFEEWNIMQQHYFLSLARKISSTSQQESLKLHEELIQNLMIDVSL